MAHIASQCHPPFDYNVLDLQDINAFVTSFLAIDPTVDLNGDGVLDLQDINVFAAEFLAGCP